MVKQFLVSAKEAVELSKQTVTVADEEFAEEIYHTFIAACEENPVLMKEFVCATLFNAGRVQGIREERNRKEKRCIIHNDTYRRKALE